jgi:hypothetical protein
LNGVEGERTRTDNRGACRSTDWRCAHVLPGHIVPLRVDVVGCPRRLSARECRPRVGLCGDRRARWAKSAPCGVVADVAESHPGPRPSRLQTPDPRLRPTGTRVRPPVAVPGAGGVGAAAPAGGHSSGPRRRALRCLGGAGDRGGLGQAGAAGGVGGLALSVAEAAADADGLCADSPGCGVLAGRPAFPAAICFGR